MCYRHEGDGKCEEFEKKTNIKDCGFYTPEGFEDQWAVNVTVNPYYRDKDCPENVVVGPPTLDLVTIIPKSYDCLKINILITEVFFRVLLWGSH